VRAKLGAESERDDKLAEKFLDAIDDLNRDLGIPLYLDKLQEADIPALAKAACHEAHTGYPVPKYMTQKQCEALIRQVLPPAGKATSEKPAAAKQAPVKKVAPKKSTQ
jgi:alcohol dehydrogenase